MGYEALGRDAVKLSVGAGKDARPCKMSTFFDPRKNLGDTFDEAVKGWREDIVEATSPSSEIAVSIGTLNINVGNEHLN